MLARTDQCNIIWHSLGWVFVVSWALFQIKVMHSTSIIPDLTEIKKDKALRALPSQAWQRWTSACVKKQGGRNEEKVEASFKANLYEGAGKILIV